MKKSIATIIATSLGFGFAPVAPGTFGTAFGLICYVALAYGYGVVDSGGYSSSLDIVLIGLIIFCTAIGTWSATVMERYWGHDNGKIVIDETIGVWITILCVPFSWINVLLAFILFRFFDILKPLGVRAIDDKMHSPFSVMLDDIVAGIYAAIVMQVAVYAMNESLIF